jgi:amino acid transporter
MASTESVRPEAAVGPSRGADRLSGNIGVFGLVCTVLAYNGPIVAFLGFVPVAILLGNGVGIPVSILACGVLIAFLAVGLTTMARKLPIAGGFYAYISAGLGKVVGLSAGLTAMMCYYVACLSVYALGGIAMRALMADVVHGPDLPWWAWALALSAVVSVLGYFRVDLSARVLTVFLSCELLFLVVYDVVVLAKGGAEGIAVDSFRPEAIFSGSIGIAFMFALGIYGGFEATVIFRDEVRDPEKTIPRATYAVVALLAVLYGATSWVFILSYGPQAVMTAVTNDPTGAATASIKQYIGTFAYDIAALLLLTSSFALMLASHNITARYAFNLSADGILHRSLSQVHGKHLSPHRASIAMTVASLIGLAVVVAANIDETLLYGRLGGLYAYTFLILLLMVALAIINYLLKHRAPGDSLLPPILTAVSAVAVVVVLYLATVNFTLLTGTTGAMTVIMLVVIYAVVVLGMVMAWIYRSRRPGVYARIGRDELNAEVVQ